MLGCLMLFFGLAIVPVQGMCKAFGKDSTNDVVPEQPRPQEKQMIQERRNCDDQQVLVCVLQDFCPLVARHWQRTEREREREGEKSQTVYT